VRKGIGEEAIDRRPKLSYIPQPPLVSTTYWKAGDVEE